MTVTRSSRKVRARRRMAVLEEFSVRDTKTADTARNSKGRIELQTAPSELAASHVAVTSMCITLVVLRDYYEEGDNAQESLDDSRRLSVIFPQLWQDPPQQQRVLS